MKNRFLLMIFCFYVHTVHSAYLGLQVFRAFRNFGTEISTNVLQVNDGCLDWQELQGAIDAYCSNNDSRVSFAKKYLDPEEIDQDSNEYWKKDILDKKKVSFKQDHEEWKALTAAIEAEWVNLEISKMPTPSDEMWMFDMVRNRSNSQTTRLKKIFFTDRTDPLRATVVRLVIR